MGNGIQYKIKNAFRNEIFESMDGANSNAVCAPMDDTNWLTGPQLSSLNQQRHPTDRSGQRVLGFRQ
jgi:hypothetical protein